MLEIQSDFATVTVSPELGASIVDYALHDGRQILRPSTNPSDGFDCACYLLGPWCNRIDGGITGYDGRFIKVPPTHPRFPLPIHGSAALLEWDVLERTTDRAALAAIADWPEPFHYRSEVTYRLTDAALSIELAITHLGEIPLHYGMGIHPWFKRTPMTMLRASASHWQKTDDRMLPIGDVPIAARSAWNFDLLRGLPEDEIDTAFGGWDGTATLLIDQKLSLRISTRPELNHYQIYSTGNDADFVCFEPVTHPVNAHNMPGWPGLQMLNCNEQMSIRVDFSPVLN